jgi:hypothetical protein
MPERPVRYLDKKFFVRGGFEVERNGNLLLIRDAETGEEHWAAPHEVSRAPERKNDEKNSG